MVTLLSVLTSSSKHFPLNLQSPRSCPDLEIRLPPPSIRSILPALRGLYFKGVTEYLEDLVTFIDTPPLNILHITFLSIKSISIPHDSPSSSIVHQHSEHSMKHVCDLDDSTASVKLFDTGHLSLASSIFGYHFSCREPDWQLSSIEQVCNSSLHHLSTVEDLYIKKHQYSQLVWKNDAIENTLWLQLLITFTVVKNLYLSKEFGARYRGRPAGSLSVPE